MVMPDQDTRIPGKIKSLTGLPVADAEDIELEAVGDLAATDLQAALSEINANIPNVDNLVVTATTLPAEVNPGGGVLVGDRHYSGVSFNTRDIAFTPAEDPTAGEDDQGYARGRFGIMPTEDANPWLHELIWDDDSQSLLLRVESGNDPGPTINVTHHPGGRYAMVKAVGEGAGTPRNIFVTGPNRWQYEQSVFTNPFAFVSGEQRFTVAPTNPITFWQQITEPPTVDPTQPTAAQQITAHAADPDAHHDPVANLPASSINADTAGFTGHLSSADNTVQKALDTLDQAGAGGGLSSVVSDATLSGTGAAGSPLSVANPFTQPDEDKLDGIAEGAQVNVKPDWAASPGAAAEILNKPNIPQPVTSLPGSAITLNTASFDDNLSNAVTNVQQLAQAVDDLTAGGTTLTPDQTAALTKAMGVLLGFTEFQWLNHDNAVDQGAFYTNPPVIGDLNTRTFGNSYTYTADINNVYKGFRVAELLKNSIESFRVTVGDAVIAGNSFTILGDDQGFTYFYVTIASYTQGDSIVLQTPHRIDLVADFIDREQWADTLEGFIDYNNLRNKVSIPNPLMGFALISNRDAVTVPGTVGIVYGDTDANNGVYYRGPSAWEPIVTVKDIAAVNTAADARIAASISSTPPGNTPGSPSAGSTGELSDAGHDHGTQPGTGGGGLTSRSQRRHAGRRGDCRRPAVRSRPGYGPDENPGAGLSGRRAAGNGRTTAFRSNWTAVHSVDLLPTRRS